MLIVFQAHSWSSRQVGGYGVISQMGKKQQRSRKKAASKSGNGANLGFEAKMWLADKGSDERLRITAERLEMLDLGGLPIQHLTGDILRDNIN